MERGLWSASVPRMHVDALDQVSRPVHGFRAAAASVDPDVAVGRLYWADDAVGCGQDVPITDDRAATEVVVHGDRAQ